MGELIRQDKNLSIAFQASKDVLDRAGYKFGPFSSREEAKFRLLTDHELDEQLASLIAETVAGLTLDGSSY